MIFHGVIESETQCESVVAKNFEDLMALTKIFVEKFTDGNPENYKVCASCEITRDASGKKVLSMAVSISPKERR